MQSRVSVRVVSHSLVECSHVFATTTSRCCTLSFIGQIVRVRGINLILDVVG